MTTQPKAIQLAEDAKNLAGWLDRRNYAGPAIDVLGYATEIERQHAEIERLTSLVADTHTLGIKDLAQIERLEAVNAGLVEVCRQVDAHYSGSLDHQPFYVAMARVAISKAAG